MIKWFLQLFKKLPNTGPKTGDWLIFIDDVDDHATFCKDVVQRVEALTRGLK